MVGLLLINLAPITRGAYPPNPPWNISWSAGYEKPSDVEAAFNHARSIESPSLPTLDIPSNWDSRSDRSKALWLINREREDRGLQRLQGLESNVTQVAEDYAQYLLNNNQTGHYADGRSPWERLSDNPAIGACHDFLSIAENLAYFWASADIIKRPLERAIYLWMYYDSGSSWGHRHAILWYPYNDNSGSPGREGFLGIGTASGPHQGWAFSEIVVMNVFDPCPSWGAPSLPSLSINDVSQNEGSGPMVFTVTLSKTSASPVSVNYSTQNGSAFAPDDYTSTSDTLTIPAGHISGTISVPIIDDDDAESTETFNISLSSANQATISDGLGVGTIRDNDDEAPDTTAPVITLFGKNPLTIALHTSYVEPGYSAWDNVDGDITHEVVVNAQAVNTSSPGTYTVYYEVSDNAGNTGSNTRSVNVMAAATHTTLTVESTPGGSVVRPGEGIFNYPIGESLSLLAEPTYGYEFDYWRGSVWSSANPLQLTLDNTMSVTAHFKRINCNLYVDDNAINYQNGWPQFPYDSLNKALQQATDGCLIIVKPGYYVENVDLLGKDVKITSVDPQAPLIYGFPVIDGKGAGPVLRNLGNTELEGLILTGGQSETGAVVHGLAAQVLLKNCLLVGNKTTDPNGAPLHFEDSNAVFVNCTVAHNQGGYNRAGIIAENSELLIKNSIVWGNHPVDMQAEDGRVSVQHSCVGQGWSGIGSFSEDPLFALPGASMEDTGIVRDYHLQSLTGRWDGLTQTWVSDPASSPCIDAGDPNSPLDLEAEPHGDRINIGCYGGTPEASMSFE